MNTHTHIYNKYIYVYIVPAVTREYNKHQNNTQLKLLKTHNNEN